MENLTPVRSFKYDFFHTQWHISGQTAVISAGLDTQRPETMYPTDLIGYAAAILTTLAFIPQVLHTWRQRSAHGISLGMYAIFSGGVALWLVYGVLLGAWPVIVANTVTLALALSMLFMKLRYR